MEGWLLLVGGGVVGYTLWAIWALRSLPEARAYNEATDNLENVRVELDRERENWAQAKQDLEEADRKQGLLDTLRQELAGLEAKKDTLNRVKEEIAHAYEESAAADARLTELKTESSRLAGLNAAEGDRLEEAKNQSALHREDVGNLQKDVASLGVEKRVLETTLSSVREQVGNAQEERKRLQSNLEALRPEHAKLTSEVASMRQERADAQARMESLKEQLRVFEETYKGTLGQLDRQWGDSLAQWKSSQNETREMVERHWEELKNHIQNAVEIINGTWNKMKPPSAAESEEKYKDLWEPVLVEQFTDAHTASARDEQQILADLQASLEASGLSYHERDIHAFHTCLKTNDISPLTVLAGISGTGKSLLPQRYAAGMGMHYLPIPVQPRWDSPQDLFGFYNYVEQRYKAEPLARALVQMDQHTHFPDDVESLKGRMLLVLLDEMNLARVEYYFSEFLSKLETRRTINSKTAEGRSSASITFDMGALREGDTRYSTYPGSNVLFTGTMNEDETTQSLSDKVLDRANVLRFGRPRSLADKLKQEDLKHSADTSLSHAHWQRWIKEPDGTDMDAIRRDISALNEAMARVRKPFGHRVNQAIQAYVANYPVIGSQGRNHAFADQIEQRIIPKLRGLDTQEREVRMALEEIGKVIDSLEDAELSTEFESSRSGETFVWHGIDRNQGA